MRLRQILYAVSVVKRRREAKHIFYALADTHVLELVQSAMKHAAEPPMTAGFDNRNANKKEKTMTTCNLPHHLNHSHRQTRTLSVRRRCAPNRRSVPCSASNMVSKKLRQRSLTMVSIISTV